MKLLLFISFLRLIKSESITRAVPTSGSRIISGYNCSVDEYSYLASIFLSGDLFCGATLVTRRWILTAAHCCEDMKAKNTFKVQFGQSRLLENPVQTTGIEEVIMHKDYDSDNLDNDICLVRLRNHVQLSNRVRLIKRVKKRQLNEMIKKKKCNESLILGFGDQEYTVKVISPNAAKGFIDHVRCGKVMLMDRKTCQKFFRKTRITKNEICARGSGRPRTDACQGDSGGPLICQNFQIGIASSGFGCGTKNPGIYCRVDHYDDFIRSVTGAFREPPNTTESKVPGLAFFRIYELFTFIYAICIFSG